MADFSHLRTPISEVILRLPPEVRLVEESYRGIKSKARFIDQDHGEFEAIPDKVIRGLKHHPIRAEKLKKQRYTLPIEVLKTRLRDGVQIKESTYTNSSTKATFVDPVFGEFVMAPKVYCSGHDHPKRGRQNGALKRHRVDHFVNKLPPHIKLIGEFRGYKHPTTFLINGQESVMLPSSVLNMVRRRDEYKANSGPRATQIEEVLSKLPEELTLDPSTYRAAGKKARFIDHEYGEWWTLPALVMKGARHPKRPKNRHRTTLPIEKVIGRLPDHIKIDETSYASASSIARFIDDKFGEFHAIPTNVMRGHGHPLRRKSELYTTEEEFRATLPPEVRLVGPYTNTYTKVELLDSEYGAFQAYPRDIVRGFNRHRSFFNSKLEKAVASRLALTRHNRVIPGSQRQFRPDFIVKSGLYLNIDGLYYHTDHVKGENYHWEVREAAEAAGARVLQFRQDEFESRPDIIESMIANLRGESRRIAARKTKIVAVPYQEANAFFDEHHLMGTLHGCTTIGLKHEDQVVMAVSMKFSGTALELGRLATHRGLAVIGGLSKLVNHLKHQNPHLTEIKSFVDLRYATGNSLLQLGFRPVRTTRGYGYTDGTRYFNRASCRATPGLPESLLAEQRGWYRISDAGQRLFVLKLREDVFEGKLGERLPPSDKLLR